MTLSLLPQVVVQLSTLRNVVRLSVAGLLAAGVIGVLTHPALFTVDVLVARVRSIGAYGPLGFIALRVLGAALLIPGSVTAIAAGVLFGPIWGATYNLIASTGGAVLAFSIARFLAPNWVAQRLHRHVALARLVTDVEAEGWRFVAFVRLVPLFPYNVLNYALGLTRIRFTHYTLASLVCMIPADVAYVYLGYAGREALAGTEGSVRLGLIALGLLATLAFVPHFARAYFRRRRASEDSSRTP